GAFFWRSAAQILKERHHRLLIVVIEFGDLSFLVICQTKFLLHRFSREDRGWIVSESAATHAATLTSALGQHCCGRDGNRDGHRQFQTHASSHNGILLKCGAKCEHCLEKFT